MTLPKTFPEEYADWYPHMFLMETGKNTYNLSPPNQCDWFFDISEISPDRWIVIGRKDDIINDIYLKSNSIYVLKNKRWIKENEEVSSTLDTISLN